MWRKEVRGSNNCLSGLTRLELNHRKNCWKSQVSFLSETEKYPLPASSAGQHFGPSRAGENLILLIVAVDFLRNFSEILCTGLIFQPLRLSLHFPRGLEEAEKIMAGAGSDYKSIHSIFHPHLGTTQRSALLKTQRGGKSYFLEQFPHYCWWKCPGPSPRLYWQLTYGVGCRNCQFNIGGEFNPEWGNRLYYRRWQLVTDYENIKTIMTILCF